MLEKEPRFDMGRAPMRQHLGWLIWLLSVPARVKHRNRIERIGMEGVKPPYLLLCNHNAFMDFMVASHCIFPARANFVVAIDGFIGREWLLRFIGCICTRKFTRDMTLVRHLREVVKRGDVAVIYPEARYSLCGTTAVLPESLGKLAKLLRVPIVVLLCHGHHINSPFYHLPDHGVRGTRAELRLLMDTAEVAAASPEEINRRIREAFVYDDFAWQRENRVRVRYGKRAEGLHKVLYQCCACGREYRMASEGTRLFCRVCGKAWELSEYGELAAADGDTRFSHVPDWYEWERENVRREVEAGTYRFESPVHINALPNAKRFIPLGPGRLIHDGSGFHVSGQSDGEDFLVEIPVPEMYSCHIEYEYLGKYGDCIDLNTFDSTLYIYPECGAFSVTKIALATEELYELDRRRKQEERERRRAGSARK